MDLLSRVMVTFPPFHRLDFLPKVQYVSKQIRKICVEDQTRLKPDHTQHEAKDEGSVRLLRLFVSDGYRLDINSQV